MNRILDGAGQISLK